MQIILAHPVTDFDALAAQQIATYLYPDAVPILAPQLNDNVAEFVGLYRDQLRFVQREDITSTPITRCILVDTERIWGNWQFADEHELIIIDHHPASDDAPPATQRITDQVGATTTLLLQRLLESNTALTPTEFTLCLLGIYEDTGNLTYADTTALDVRCAATLLERGADLGAVRRYLHRALTPEQEQAYHALASNLHVRTLNGWPVVTGWAQLAQHTPGLAGLADRLREVYTPAVLIIALGMGDGGTQLIARANEEALDAGRLMEAWGGGGHAAAAAAFVADRAPAAVWHAIDQQLPDLVSPAASAADIMTRQLRSLAPDATVQEAADLLRRWGYEAVPVLENGKLRGDISWAELVKAERHGLSDAPVRRYVWRSPATVAADTTLRELRRTVATEPRGRAYVIDDQRTVLGVVTRGDLLHHTDRPVGRSGDDQRRMALFRQALSTAVAQYVDQAGQIAAAHGWGIYAVGGFVRDLLLARPPGDLDLVVEGDAIVVARELAAATDGTLRAHEQFGTASVTWNSDHLDFITARTEFYEHPTALPQVEAASLRHDLHRRDFTINTLALTLTPQRQGYLYDFYGGLRDLERGLIRVLHNLSFIDDPTRLLRAVRLAARLGFRIEGRTGELIADAIEQDVLNRTTPARIRHELRLLLQEPDPATALHLLAEWGLLTALHPALRWNTELEQQFTQVLALDLPLATRRDVLLVVLLAPLDAQDRWQIVQRYRLPLAQQNLIAQWASFAALHPTLADPDLSDSRLDQLLAPFNDSTLIAAEVVSQSRVAERIRYARTVLRPTPTLLSGHDIRATGLKPGPRYRTILEAARVAQLDGAFTDHAGALAWLNDYLALNKGATE